MEKEEIVIKSSVSALRWFVLYNTCVFREVLCAFLTLSNVVIILGTNFADKRRSLGRYISLCGLKPRSLFLFGYHPTCTAMLLRDQYNCGY
jgi:hypothetical protein